MLFVCYPKCSTCQKAQKALEAYGAQVTIRNIKEERPTREEIAVWHQMSGLPLSRFFNTSGLQYRALGLKDRLAEMSDAQMIDLLASDGMLVKRPLLILHDRVLVGFKENEWAQALENT